MTTHANEIRCHRCGEVMEDGFTRTRDDLIGGHTPPGDPNLVFVVRGEKTSLNPIEAFKQGVRGDRANKAYLLHGCRCPRCGLVELFGLEDIAWEP